MHPPTFVILMPPFLFKIVNKFSDRLNDGNVKQLKRSMSDSTPKKKSNNKKISKRGFSKSKSADSLLPITGELTGGGGSSKSQNLMENPGGP